MISVLLPTRGRPEALQKSVESLRNLATTRTDFEVLLSFDSDDVRLLDYMKVMKSMGVLFTMRISKRAGYSRLHEYYNALAGSSQGDLLMLWNDDAVMLTRHWNKIIHTAADLSPDALVFELEDQMWPGLCCFPVVRRSAVFAVGGFSPHTPHCDTYWQDMSRTLRRNAHTGVRISHERADITGENRDATYTEGQSSYQTAGYYSAETQALIAADIETLRSM